MIVILKKIEGMFYAIEFPTEYCIAMGANRDTIVLRAVERADTIIIDSSFKETVK